LFRFKAYHVFEHSEEELLANPNVFALVVLTCQAEAQEARLGDFRINEIKKRIMEGLAERGVTDRGQVMRFIRFLNGLLYLPDKGLNHNFANTIEQVTKGENAMTFDEIMDMVEREREEWQHERGRHEGKLEGKL